MKCFLSSGLNCFVLLVAMVAVLSGCGPSDGLSDLAAGKAAYEAGDFVRAEKLLSRSLEDVPGRVDTLVHYALVKLALGKFDDVSKAVATARTLAEGAYDVELLAGQLAWHKKEYASAEKIFTKLAEDTSLPVEVRSQAWAEKGIVEMTCDEIDFARVSFLTAIRLNRKNAAAWYHLALLYRDGFGYLESSLENFNIYVRLDTQASARVAKVQRTLIPGLQDSIRRTASERPGASRRNSAASAAALSAAETAFRKKRYKEAVAKYKEALKLDVLSYPAALGLAKALEASDSSASGKAAVFEAYRTACTLRAGALSTYLAAGALAMNMGRYAEAKEIYSRAVAADPMSFTALDGLIAALGRLNSRGKQAARYQRYREMIKPIKKR
ncbi:MAG: tetratricopeptide repeat protein [Kiritimatiellae bacterium]|nr:tetratricopeptide repeat protein [Kiritimatiellia bacterium]